MGCEVFEAVHRKRVVLSGALYRFEWLEKDKGERPGIVQDGEVVLLQENGDDTKI